MFLRPVVFKKKIGITLQKKTEVSILTAKPRRNLADFYKMTGYPSFELKEAKSGPIFLELLLLRKKCFCTGKKKLKVVIIF